MGKCLQVMNVAILLARKHLTITKKVTMIIHLADVRFIAIVNCLRSFVFSSYEF